MSTSPTVQHVLVPRMDESNVYWQCPSHDHLRKRISLWIFRTLMKRGDDVQEDEVHVKHKYLTKTKQQLALLATRLEQHLYSSAHSYLEYKQLSTLRRRLTKLAFDVYGRVQPDTLTNKSSGQHGQKPKRSSTPAQSVFLLNNNPHLIHLIYSYVDTTDQIRHECINRFCHAVLPQGVTCLTLEIARARVAFQLNLSKYSHLTSLRLVNRFSTKGQFLPLRTPDRGEDVICSLANLLAQQQHLFPRLTHLSIEASCISSTSIPLLMSSLCQRENTNKGLLELNLAGCCLGDLGALAVAEYLIHDNSRALGKIHLQRNFIGQRGSLALTAALAKRENRLVVDLEDNLILLQENQKFPASVSLKGNFQALE